ncbi:MAG TPA: hypothetical protein VGH23_21820 [Rhizomicrobium sp.]
MYDDQPGTQKRPGMLEAALLPLSGRMGRTILGAALSLGLAVTSQADEGMGGFEKTLKAVPTISGLSAYGRMKACGIRIEQSSFAQFAPRNSPGHAVGNGDGILNVMLTLPPIHGATAPDPDLYRDVVARWYIWNGKAFPRNGWAQRIQYQPPPLEWMNC